MKVVLKRDTAVRFAAGTVLEVEEKEGLRLIAFTLAEKVDEPKPKKTTKRAAK